MNFTKSVSCILFVISSLAISAQKIALVGAMPEEIRLLTENLVDKNIVSKGGLTFYEGKLQDKEVVILQSGVGKVNAAYSTTILLQNFAINKVIFTGVAGGLHPESFPGDMVIGQSVFHHDYVWHLANEYTVRSTTNPSTNRPNPQFFPCDSALQALAMRVSKEVSFIKVGDKSPEIFTGVIATGDTFLSNSEKAKWLYGTFDALAVEMEGAALGQICYQNDVPFLVIRSCSDNANNQAHLDFGAFMKPAAENSIRLVMALLKQI